MAPTPPATSPVPAPWPTVSSTPTTPPSPLQELQVYIVGQLSGKSITGSFSEQGELITAKTAITLSFDGCQLSIRNEGTMINEDPDRQVNNLLVITHDNLALKDIKHVSIGENTDMYKSLHVMLRMAKEVTARSSQQLGSQVKNDEMRTNEVAFEVPENVDREQIKSAFLRMAAICSAN